MATVTTEAALRAAITIADPEIIIANDINVTLPITISYTLNMKGRQEGVSLFWTGPSSASGRRMLIVAPTGVLTVDSLILDAQGRDGTLVWVSGGKFIMNDDVIIRNIYSRSSNNGVAIGDIYDTIGGTFIMNGGLITGVDSSDAVFCGGGDVEMHGNAAIDNNLSAGLTMTDTILEEVRCTLTMTGNARISNNKSRQGANAGILMGTDIFMGVNEGDAPIVTGNSSDQYSVGGWLLSVNTNLTMRYGAKISDNHSQEYGGGIALRTNSTLTMHDNAAIEDNTTSGVGGGVSLDYGSTLTMDGNSKISGNTGGDMGGGLQVQNGSILYMKGNAVIEGNTAQRGGGIGIYRGSAYVGQSDSSPKINGNTATVQGGGAFVSTEGRLDLTGETVVSGNAAPEGQGIYKMGALNLSGSPRIEDGLFFDDLSGAAALLSEPCNIAVPGELRIPLDSPDPAIVLPHFIEQEQSVAAEPIYTDNVPVIADALTSDALIQLEQSGHVNPPNVPLVISDKGVEYAQLVELDRAAWRIPQSFGPGHVVVLIDSLDKVLIDYEEYPITYLEMDGIQNPNPTTYNLSDLPIILQDPGMRPGHSFEGWHDQQGNRIYEITEDMLGELTLTAVWKPLFLSFEPGAPCVWNMPRPMRVEQGAVILPPTVPCRRGYSFLCWNLPDSGSGKVYFPGDTIEIGNGSVRLCAKWLKLCGCAR